MKKVIAIAISSALMSASAYAHKEGDTIIKGGWASFKSEMGFDYDYRDQKEDKKNNSNGFALSLTHMASDKIGIELGYASGMTTTYNGSTSYAGITQNNRYSIKGAPITLTANYYFGDANSKFRPYIGAGIAYVNFKSPSVSQTFDDPAVSRVSSRALDCSPFGGCVEVPDVPSNETWPEWDMDNAMGVYPEPDNMGTPDSDNNIGDLWPDSGTGTPDNNIGTPTTTRSIENVQVDPGFGLAAKVGADYYVTDNFMITASVTYMDVKSKLSWSEKVINDHGDGNVNEYNYKYSADMKVDPVYAMIGIGYRF